MKKYIVELLKTDEIELKEACDWYDEQQPGLAARLLSELNYYFDLIREDPFLFPVRYSKIHRVAVLKVFPYLIVFRINEKAEKIFVISLFHTSRKPKRFML